MNSFTWFKAGFEACYHEKFLAEVAKVLHGFHNSNHDGNNYARRIGLPDSVFEVCQTMYADGKTETDVLHYLLKEVTDKRIPSEEAIMEAYHRYVD